MSSKIFGTCGNINQSHCGVHRKRSTCTHFVVTKGGTITSGTFTIPNVRDVSIEKNKVQTGKAGALSSKKSKYYHDIPVEFLKRVAERYTGGHVKYSNDITMNLNWREGLDDPFYVMDRYNHLWEHLIDFQENLNSKDDNLGAIAWCCAFLMEVERLHPEMLEQIINQSRFHGKTASQYKDWLKKEQNPS